MRVLIRPDWAGDTTMERPGTHPSRSPASSSPKGFCEAVRPRRGKLLSPECRRRAVVTLKERYRASERLVCRVVSQYRSTQRHGGKIVDLEEAKLRNRLREIAAAPAL